MSRNKPLIVLDTNVFLVSISPKFSYYWIYQKLLKGKYDLLVSNKILTEYAEKINDKFGLSLADSSLDFVIAKCLSDNSLLLMGVNHQRP
jgi:predicted nucleic acid-binding protein